MQYRAPWALLALTLAACSSKSSGAPGDASADANANANDDGGVSDAAANPVKAPIQGLIDMQDISWHDAEGGDPTFTMDNVNLFPSVFGGIVINATWSALQPSQNGPLDFSSVDDALAQVRAYNAANPSAALGVKLRVYHGISAPDWAKTIGGGPVTIQRNPQGCNSDAAGACSLVVGKFWTTDYIAAWRAFQTHLAAKYDGEPLIRQVAVTSCASQTDEPFVPTVDVASREVLSAAGYTDEAQMACLSGAVDDFAAWKDTLIDFTFNVFGTEAAQDAGPRITADAGAGFALGVMAACRSSLGSRCVLDNHALSVPLRASDQPIYEAIQAMGGPTNFQTDAPKGIHCEWAATIAEGVALGAEAIEVWPETKYAGFDSLMAPQVASLAAEFTKPIPVPTQPDATPSCPGFN